jgi:hypothetical protein
MDKISADLSFQEKDLLLFLNALEIKLPAFDPHLPNEYIVNRLDQRAASVFESKDGRAVMLSYRYEGYTYPISILFITGEKDISFGHSTLLLDFYTNNKEAACRLRNATWEFFSQNEKHILEILEPAWINLAMKELSDHRIWWDMKPTLKIATDLIKSSFGQVPEIPLFPSVYSYNNPYVENLLEIALPELIDCKKVLVLGTGAGLEAACIALKYKINVDATDINPVAIANTKATSRRLGVDKLVQAWVSDGFNNINSMYDAIVFEAPLAIEETVPKDSNRYDPGGNLLKNVLANLPAHLNQGGRMYLMNNPDLSPYIQAKELRSQARRFFVPKRNVAIHEVWIEYD